MSDTIYEYLEQTFEWDDAKARKNWSDHRVLFTEAATVFFDQDIVVFEIWITPSTNSALSLWDTPGATGGFSWCMCIAGRELESLARVRLRRKRGTPMKPKWEDEYEMPAEFNFSRMKRIPNPFFQKFRDLHLVSLDDDVASVFPDSEAVNTALRQAMAEGSFVRPHRDLKKAS